MEAEDVNRAAQGAQSTARQNRAAVRLQRIGDGLQIGAELLRALVGGGVADRLAQGHDMVEFRRSLGDARIDSGDGAPIGFVVPGGGMVG